MLELYRLIFICCSCNNSDKRSTPKEYSFSVKAVADARYYYTIKNEVETAFEVNDKKASIGKEVIVGLFYEIRKDSANSYLIKITYDKFHVVISKTGEKEVYDADNRTEDSEQMEKVLADIKGSTLSVYMNAKGEVLKAIGSNEIAGKVLANLTTNDANDKKRIQEMLNQFTGEAFIKNNLRQNFSPTGASVPL